MPCRMRGPRVLPVAENGGKSFVHDLFRWSLVVLLLLGVRCHELRGEFNLEFRVEATTGTVSEAARKWLGDMAKAVPVSAETSRYPPPIL
jgi:hypothetical protein